MTRRMHRIRGLVVAVLLVLAVAMLLEYWSPPWWRRLSYPLDYEQHIAGAAKRHSVDPYLVAALIRVESSFDPEVRSPKGATGLMQLLPSTARYVAKRRGRKFAQADLLRPEYNIDVGTYYMSYLLVRYGTLRYALAAYNGGEANVDRWIAGREGDDPAKVVRDIPFPETRRFVTSVLVARSAYAELYPDAFDAR